MGLEYDACLIWGAPIKKSTDLDSGVMYAAPWLEVDENGEERFYDIEDWWRWANGFVFPPLPTTAEFSNPYLEKYVSDFDDRFPLLYTVIDDGGYAGDEGSYFGLKKTARIHGLEPLPVEDSVFNVADEDRRLFYEFVNKYKIHLAKPACWLLWVRIS